MATKKDKTLKDVKAAKEVKKEVKTTAKVETPKDEKKETPAPAEEKKEVKPIPKVEQKPEVKPEPKAEKKEEKKPEKKAKKEEKVPTVVPEEAELKHKIPAHVPMGAETSSFDGKANLAYVMQKRYMENKDLKEHYPEFYNAMGNNLDVVVVLSLVDIQNELSKRANSGELKLMVSPDQILQLNDAAAMLGIKLAPAKALPGKDGQMEINFTESEVPDELKDSKETKEEPVELDPKKITTEEELDKALEHLLNDGRNTAKNIANTIEWYRVYSIEKEQNADKKLELDDRTVSDWLNDIFSHVSPKGLFKGLGGACYTYTATSGNPVMAQCVLHKHTNGLGWSDEQVAQLVKFFINGTYKLKVQEDMANKDPKKSKAINAIIGNLGLPFIDSVFKNVDSKDSPEAGEAKRILGLIRTNYFEKDEHPTIPQLRVALGKIINLYRDPSDQIEEFAMLKEGEYPESEEKKPEEKETEKKN